MQHSDEERIEYLNQISGQYRVHFAHLPCALKGDLGLRGDGHPSVSYFTHEASMADFLVGVGQCLRDPGFGVVYAQSRPLKGFPEIALRVAPEVTVRGAHEAATRVWIGSGGHVNGLHFDCFGNFLFMVAGHKRVCLLPPDVIRYLDPTPPRGGIGGATSSFVRLLAPDSARHPGVWDALQRATYVVLRPGDMLFIPPNWWHHVEAVGLNVMINVWVHTIDRSAIDTLEALLREALQMTQGLPAADCARVRSIFRRATAGELDPIPPFEDLPLATRRSITAILRDAQALRLPPSWRQFVGAACDYYLFEARSIPERRTALELYARSVNKSEHFINDEL